MRMSRLKIGIANSTKEEEKKKKRSGLKNRPSKGGNAKKNDLVIQVNPL